jgi:hypothetical protein
MTTIASLPPALLWAASLAASTDPAKGPICAIEARQQGSSIRLVGVDGHRCFRCLLPAAEPYFVPEEPLRLSPKAFSKAPTKKAVLVEIDDGGVASFKDKLGNVISSVVWQADPWALSEQPFPNIEQIWPNQESLVNAPGEFIAMNAAYAGDFMKIAAKLGAYPGIARLFTTDSSTKPMIWRTLLDNDWLVKEEGEVWLDYLLSPVLIRKD